MERWMDLVYQRTEVEFIPWYTGYWTQQWLTMKVAWYQLASDPTAERLTRYLREEYQEQVLDPVSEQTDPQQVMSQATAQYIQQLSASLPVIAQRYAVPQAQFDQHLQDIPAIALAPPANHSASLYQLTQAKAVDQLPAYGALVARIKQAGAQAGRPDIGMSSVAQRASEKLEAQVVTKGVSSSAAAVVGKAAGLLISVGVAGVGMIMHESERPEVEIQVRKTLNAAFDEEWLRLLRNRRSGVLAGVYYLSDQVEGSLGKRVPQPVPAAPGIPAPYQPPLQFNYRHSPEHASESEAYE
jgi:hypothetical protein